MEPKIIIYLAVLILALQFVSADIRGVEFPEAKSPINYSLVNVNNSQYLQGYTPSTLPIKNIFDQDLNTTSSITFYNLTANSILTNSILPIGASLVFGAAEFVGTTEFNNPTIFYSSSTVPNLNVTDILSVDYISKESSASVMFISPSFFSNLATFDDGVNIYAPTHLTDTLESTSSINATYLAGDGSRIYNLNNMFDQTLNTTDDPTFDDVKVTKGINTTSLNATKMHLGVPNIANDPPGTPIEYRQNTASSTSTLASYSQQANNSRLEIDMALTAQGWGRNFFAMMGHGAAFANDYYLGDGIADKGNWLFVAQGQDVTKLGFLTYTNTAVEAPIVFAPQLNVRMKVNNTGMYMLPTGTTTSSEFRSNGNILVSNITANDKLGLTGSYRYSNTSGGVCIQNFSGGILWSAVNCG